MHRPNHLSVRRLTLASDGVRIIDDVSASFRPGTMTAIIGPNGAGKTSLFNAICGLLRPSQGDIYLGERRLTGLEPYRVARLGVGRLYQSPRTFETLSLQANVQVACLTGFAESWLASLAWPLLGSRRDHAARVKALSCLESVGLAHLSGYLACELSFGQQKLLAVATLMASDAQCLLLDEPTAGLSHEAAHRVLGIARSVARNGGTVVVIEHNVATLSDFCDEVLSMERGRIVPNGSTQSRHREKSVVARPENGTGSV